MIHASPTPPVAYTTNEDPVSNPEDVLFTDYDFENDLDCDLAYLTNPVESGYATISYTH